MDYRHVINVCCWTDQWRRSVCRKADSPSITSRIPTVSTAHGAKRRNISTELNGLSSEKPRCSTMLHRTSDSSAHRQTDRQTDRHTQQRCSTMLHRTSDSSTHRQTDRQIKQMTVATRRLSRMTQWPRWAGTRKTNIQLLTVKLTTSTRESVMSGVRLSIRLSRQHTHRDSPGGSMWCGQRTFWPTITTNTLV